MRCNMQWHSLYIQLFCFNTIPSTDDDRWDPWWQLRLFFAFFFTNGRNNNKKKSSPFTVFSTLYFYSSKRTVFSLKRQQETLSSFCFAVVVLRFDIGLVFYPRSSLRSTCGGQWMDRTRRTPAWRSTSVGRWRGRPRWIRRSIRSTSSRGEQWSWSSWCWEPRRWFLSAYGQQYLGTWWYHLWGEETKNQNKSKYNLLH